MKKTAITLLCCLFALFAQAQTEHMKFMGIPINGTIDQFQAKLQGKGLKYDAQTSRRLESRFFTGYFAGERSEIYVYYNKKNKIVYRTKVVIKRSNLNQIEDLMEDFKTRLKKKYSNSKTEDNTNEGYPEFDLYYYGKNGNYIGALNLFIGYNNGEYVLHIDYYDTANTLANEQRNNEDL